VIIIAAIIGVVMLLTRSNHNDSDNARYQYSDRTPSDILKDRYAKGEIDRQEYESMMHTLQ
jgi:uncharacterized membrane protein